MRGAGIPTHCHCREGFAVDDDNDLWDREERFWTEGADSARHMTMKGAVFVFPYPVGILQGDALWRAPEVAQRWRSVVMGDRLITHRGDIALMAYHISAERKDQPIYEGLCSSVYVIDDDSWLWLTHQQTPVS
jgi:hypothetical protein